jgi:hypothetical protein
VPAVAGNRRSLRSLRLKVIDRCMRLSLRPPRLGVVVGFDQLAGGPIALSTLSLLRTLHSAVKPCRAAKFPGGSRLRASNKWSRGRYPEFSA